MLSGLSGDVLSSLLRAHQLFRHDNGLRKSGHLNVLISAHALDAFERDYFGNTFSFHEQPFGPFNEFARLERLLNPLSLYHQAGLRLIEVKQSHIT